MSGQESSSHMPQNWLRFLRNLSHFVICEYVVPIVYPAEFTLNCSLDWKNKLPSVNAYKSKQLRKNKK